MYYFDYIKMTHYNIPDNLVNDIVMMSRRKPLFVRHLDLICENVEIQKMYGLGDYRVIDYVMNKQTKQKLYELKTYEHKKVIYQLNHLISEYNSDKEMDDDFGDTSLGEWFHWHYDNSIFTDGDRNYASSYYSSEDDDN